MGTVDAARHCAGRPGPEGLGGDLRGAHHVEGAGVAEGLGADQLLQSRGFAGHDQRGGVGGEDLADGVVPAHGDHGGGLGDLAAQARPGAVHLRAGGGLRGDGLETGVVELRPGDDDVLVPVRDAHRDGGAQQFVAVGTAARGGEHERFGFDRFAVVADATVVGEVAGEADAVGQGGRGLSGGDGVVDGGSP